MCQPSPLFRIATPTNRASSWACAGGVRSQLLLPVAQQAAAAAAGMSERSARTWQEGPVPTVTKAPPGKTEE